MRISNMRKMIGLIRRDSIKVGTLFRHENDPILLLDDSLFEVIRAIDIKIASRVKTNKNYTWLQTLWKLTKAMEININDGKKIYNGFELNLYGALFKIHHKLINKYRC